MALVQFGTASSPATFRVPAFTSGLIPARRDFRPDANSCLVWAFAGRVSAGLRSEKGAHVDHRMRCQRLIRQAGTHASRAVKA